MDHPVKQLALKYAIPLLKNDVEHEFNENLIYDFHGKLLTLDDIPTNADKIPKLLEEIRENLIKSNSSDITYEKAFDILEQKYPQLVQHHFVKYVQKIGEESLNAATLDQISLIYGDGVPNSTEEIEYKGFDLVPPKGYRQILDSLISGGRGFQVELGRKVETIKYDASTNGRVELTAVDMKSNDQYKYSADHVIVAVPLGVLKANQINFIPKLPMAMLKAIENIGFGNFVKVLMVFDKSFWSNKKFFSTETETGFPFFFVNIERINNLPALCAVVISHGATMADELPESEVIKRVLDRMKIMFGSETVQARKLLHSRVTRWHNDPLVRGSYSFGKIGMSAEDAYNIRTPIKPHLFFAGEHTCFPENQNGNVHAAYLSGMRVANEIMEQHG